MCKAPLAAEASAGLFFAPRAYELASLDAIEREVFGPILHIVRFESHELEALVDRINAKGYGLTMGVHSRIEETIECVRLRACAVRRERRMT